LSRSAVATRRECGQKRRALVGATYLARPVLPSRCHLPPTLTYCRGRGAQAAASKALALVEERRQHKAATRAAMSAASSLVGRQPRQEVVSPHLFDAASGRIQATCELLAAPLDAILADIERDDIQSAARAKESAALTLTEERSRHEAATLLAASDEHRRHKVAARTAESEALALAEGHRCHKAVTWASLSAASPLVDKQSRHEGADRAATLATLALAALPRARPCHRTGRRHTSRAPSSFVEVAPTHPELSQGGLTTPPSTTLAGATSPSRLVVSSTPPAWTTPHTPSLQPFSFDEGAFLSYGGGNAHPFCAQGLSLPPWKRTRRKHHPNRICWRHRPHAPNQSTGWA
jgi:hypothetical protein